MIRVAFICDSFDLGGQELGCLALMQRLDRQRFEPRLYTFRPGSLIREAVASCIPVMIGYDKMPADRSWNPADDLARDSYRARLAQRLREDRIDACLVYAWPDGVVAAQAAGVHAIVERVDGISLVRRIADKSACARIICEANAVRDVILAQRAMLKCSADRVIVIRNGIDLHRFDAARYDRTKCREALGIKPGDFVLGTVCRMAPEKNLELLVRAIAELIRRYRNSNHEGIWAIIAGPDGGSREHLTKLATDLGLIERIKLLQPTLVVEELLTALDVFALTSFYEGTPFALLEAMAMGLPIVATPVGGVPEVIDGNGWLVPVMHPEVAAQALRRLSDDLSLRHELGARSRILAQSYDVDRMVREYEKQLELAVRENRDSPNRSLQP